MNAMRMSELPTTSSRPIPRPQRSQQFEHSHHPLHSPSLSSTHSLQRQSNANEAYPASLFYNSSVSSHRTSDRIYHPKHFRRRPILRLRRSLQSTLNFNSKCIPRVPVITLSTVSLKSKTKFKFCAMLTSRPSRELAPFDGNPETDVIEWLTAFDKAFGVHRHAMQGTPDQILTAKANHLHSKITEPAYSRILHELERYHANARDYHSIVTVMKRLYVNAASADLARSDLARMYQLSDESVAAFSNRLSKCVDRAYPTDPNDQREKRKLEEFTVRILPTLRLKLYSMTYTSFVDAIYQVERLETAYRAAGLPLTSSSISTHTVSSYLRDYDSRPEPFSQSRPSSSLIPHHDQLVRKEPSASPTRHGVYFQDYAKKITYHEVPCSPRHASPPQEHEPNLSLQPSKSNLKRLETRRPSPILIPPADSHSTTRTPYPSPSNSTNWIRKNPPITPPSYRRRTDGLIEPKTPQGFMRRKDPELSYDRSRNSYSRHDQRHYQQFRSNPHRHRDSSSDSSRSRTRHHQRRNDPHSPSPPRHFERYTSYSPPSRRYDSRRDH